MNRKELIGTLELLKPALADNPLVQVFECFVFTGEKVYATNDELAIVTPFKTDHAFAVNGRILLGLLHASTSDDITLDPIISDGENELVVKAGRSTFKLPYFTEAEFLFEEPAEEWTDPYLIDDAILFGLEACYATVGKDAARPALIGIHLGHSMYSCDGDALTKQDAVLHPATISGLFSETIINLGPQSICFNPEWARAQCDHLVVYGRLLQIDDPIDHEQLITDTLKTKPAWFPIPDGLNEALSRARVVADIESSMTAVTIDNSTMRLVTDTHMGVIKDGVVANAPDVKSKVSPELWQRMLKGATQMAVMPNCTVFRNENGLFRLASNLGE